MNKGWADSSANRVAVEAEAQIKENRIPADMKRTSVCVCSLFTGLQHT